CPANPLRLSLKPDVDPLDSFTHLFTRPGVAQALEVSAVDRIQIDDRRSRYAGLFQHARGEFKTIAREARYVGIEIERAVDPLVRVEPCPRQPVLQNAPMFYIAVFYVFQFVTSVKCRLGGDLRKRWN